MDRPSPTGGSQRTAAATNAQGDAAHALVVERLTKRFGDRTAFSEVSFTVDYGEVFGFLGPNGAGKTTTVRTLGTLLAPTMGSAIVAGLALSKTNGVEIRRRIAIMPESPGLYLRLTVPRTCAASPASTSCRTPASVSTVRFARSTFSTAPTILVRPCPKVCASG